MAEIFNATGYLPPIVSTDGKVVTFGVIDEAGNRLGISLPSPVNAQLIADLQNADAKAKDLFLGVPQEKGGGAAVRRTVRQPRTLAIQRDELSGSILLLIDDRLPTEMVFQMPPGSETQLGQAILPLLRQPASTPPKQ